mgnify:CR=1 FL=1
MKKKKWPFVYVAVITVLTYIPILLTVVYSFNASKLTSVWEGFSLKWYRELFRDRDLGEALINSLILAVLSCAFAVLIGTSGALGMSRRKRKLDDAVAYVSTLPIMIPEIILGMVFLSVFSLMGLPFGTTFCVPYVFTMVRARLVGMDRSLEEAALDLGATKWQVFRDVILPQILPAILSGVLLAFAMSFDDVVISIFVTGPKVNTLPVKIYTKLKTGVTPEINALATVMLFVILLCLAGAYVLGRKSQTAVEKAAGGK